MENKNDKLILVFYVGVAGLQIEDVGVYMNGIANKLTPKSFDGEVIFLPTLSSYDTRVECINPEYITDTELIKENHKILSELKYELTNQLNIIKNNSNGENKQ